MSSYSDRREHPRLTLSTEAMGALIPAAGGPPYHFRGVAMDLSLGGLRMKSYQVGSEQCNALHAAGHFCDLQLDLPYLKEPWKARSVVAWASFHEATRGDSAYTLLGLRFYEVSPDALASLQYVIHRLSGESFSMQRGHGSR